MHYLCSFAGFLVILVACVAGGIVCAKGIQVAANAMVRSSLGYFLVAYAAHGGSAAKTLPSHTIPLATQASNLATFVLTIAKKCKARISASDFLFSLPSYSKRRPGAESSS